MLGDVISQLAECVNVAVDDVTAWTQRVNHHLSGLLVWILSRLSVNLIQDYFSYCKAESWILVFQPLNHQTEQIAGLAFDLDHILIDN